MKINDNFYLTELINLESKVLKEKLRNSNKKDDLQIQQSLTLIYRELSFLSRQLIALPEEDKLKVSQVNYSQEYLDSLWGSD